MVFLSSFVAKLKQMFRLPTNTWRKSGPAWEEVPGPTERNLGFDRDLSEIARSDLAASAGNTYQKIPLRRVLRSVP